MGKMITGNEGPILGIFSSRDMFKKLKFESASLKNDWKNPYVTFNFLVTAWHLATDWTFSDASNALCRMKRQRRRLPALMNLVLDVVRDIVNGSKHFHLKPDAVSKRRVTEVHTGEEMGFYEWLFHEHIPAVTVDGHWYFSTRILHNIVMRYFEWVFDDEAPLKQFPDELLDAIDYCHVGGRHGKSAPAIWLVGIESAYDD